MSVVDTSTWKPFRVGDLFDVIRGTSRIMRNLHDGDTPLIAAARAEQGVAGYFDIKPEYANAITVSCNGAGCGSTFFHKGEFAITGDASVLLAKDNFSESALLFIASVLDSRFTSIYSYAEKCGPAVLLNSAVLLPATPDGEPDWASGVRKALTRPNRRAVAVTTDETFPYRQSGDELTRIVSARFPLEEDYAPDDLINLYEHKDRGFELSRADIELRQPAYEAAQAMFTAAKADGVAGFILTSGFRTREYQQTLYEEGDTGYVNAPGQKSKSA